VTPQGLPASPPFLNEKGTPEWSEALALYSNEAGRALWGKGMPQMIGQTASHGDIVHPQIFTEQRDDWDLQRSLSVYRNRVELKWRSAVQQSGKYRRYRCRHARRREVVRHGGNFPAKCELGCQIRLLLVFISMLPSESPSPRTTVFSPGKAAKCVATIKPLVGPPVSVTAPGEAFHFMTVGRRFLLTRLLQPSNNDVINPDRRAGTNRVT
jgi:hypothetical protein